MTTWNEMADGQTEPDFTVECAATLCEDDSVVPYDGDPDTPDGPHQMGTQKPGLPKPRPVTLPVHPTPRPIPNPVPLPHPQN